MKDEMEKDLSESTASEQSQASDYDSLVSAKKKQKTALTKAIETGFLTPAYRGGLWLFYPIMMVA
jgi:hypothetical protein